MENPQDEIMGEAGLTREEVGALVHEALDGLRAKGITSAVLVAHVNNGDCDYVRYGYRGCAFTVRGLLSTAIEWIRGDYTPLIDEEESR